MEYEEEEYRVIIRRDPVTKKRLLEAWRRVEDNKLHLIDGHAHKTFHPTTENPEVLSYYIGGYLHDVDGSAYSRYDEDGNLVKEQSFIHGKFQEPHNDK